MISVPFVYVPHLNFIVDAITLSLQTVLEVLSESPFDLGFSLFLCQWYHFVDVVEKLMVINRMVLYDSIDGGGL